MPEGFIYVGLAESKPMYTVEVEFLDGGLPSSRDEKVPGKISCNDPTFTELSFSGTPLWFSLKGDNMRYEIKVYQDGSCEVSRSW
jgi:hypothetical protein